MQISENGCEASCEDLWGHWVPQAQHLDLASGQLRPGTDDSLSYQGFP